MRAARRLGSDDAALRSSDASEAHAIMTSWVIRDSSAAISLLVQGKREVANE